MNSKLDGIFTILSKRGQEIFYPKGGILAQSAEASKSEYNATIGISNYDDKSQMHYGFVDKIIDLPINDIYPYVSSFGKDSLRTYWKTHIKESNLLVSANFSNPVVTGGITNALAIAGFLFIDEVDNIVIHDKYWSNYDQIFGQFSKKFKTYNTFQNGSFDLKAFEQCVVEQKGKTVIVFNFPNNPSGFTPSEVEMKAIGEIIQGHCENGNKTVVIVDDAYFGLFYEENCAKKSLFSYLFDLHENLIVVKADGASKEDFAWGLRVGFISFNSKALSENEYKLLEDKSAGYIRATISNVSNLSQSLLEKIYKHPEYKQEKDKNFEILKKRYVKVKQYLSDNKKFKEHFSILPFNSGYFMCIEPTKMVDIEKFRTILLTEFSTGVITQENIIRIAFSSVKESDIEVLFGNIINCFEKL